VENFERYSVRQKRQIISRILVLLRGQSIVIITILLIIIMSIVSDVFLTLPNILNILRQISINGIVAIGMTFVLISGAFDLSVGSIMGLAGVIVAGALEAGVLPIIAIILALSCGLSVGVVNGFFVSKLRANAFIITMSTQIIVLGLALLYSKARPIVIHIPESIFSFIGKGSYLGVPLPVFIFIIFAVISQLVISQTTFGRSIFAIGGNELAAFLSGIKTIAYRMVSFIICGFSAALAGIILTSRLNSALATTGRGAELDAIAAAVIGGTSLFGGKGSIFHTAIGALILGIISNSMTLLNVPYFYQYIAKGLIILIFVWLEIIGREANEK